jgi:hypothetical protein
MKKYLFVVLFATILFSCKKDPNTNSLINYYLYWGLGDSLQEKYNNDRKYEWYIDQINTGEYSSHNCGPTSVTMAIKWFNRNFNKTPQDARAVYKPNGEDWSTNDIINYLNLNHVNNITIKLDSINQLKSELRDSNIVILCVDMYYIRYTAVNNYRVDKFYYTPLTFGHFIIIKGYLIVDNRLFYEVYDPNSWGSVYDDNTYKGKNRYYRSEDIDVQ